MIVVVVEVVYTFSMEPISSVNGAYQKPVKPLFPHIVNGFSDYPDFSEGTTLCRRISFVKVCKEFGRFSWYATHKKDDYSFLHIFYIL